MLLKCRVDDRQEFFEFLDRSRESYLNNLIFRDCAMDHERVVASIVALLFLIIAIRKAQRFRFLALYFVFERRQRDLTNALLATRIKRLQEQRRRGALARLRRVASIYLRNCACRRSKAHVYKAGARNIQQSHEMLLKIYDKMSLNKQS